MSDEAQAVGTVAGGMVELIREIAGGAYPDTDRPDIVFGVVKSPPPDTRIMVENKFEVGNDFLFLSQLCYEKRIPKSYIDEDVHTHVVPAHTTGDASVGDHGSHTHSVSSVTTQGRTSEIKTILIWRGLEAGDKVVMLRLASGQKYYVLQREGELT